MWEWWSRKSKVGMAVWTSLHNSQMNVHEYKIMFIFCYVEHLFTSNGTFSLNTSTTIATK